MDNWKPVPGYAGLYEVADTGKVRSLIVGRELKSHSRAKGYLTVSLCRDKTRKTWDVHVLVALAFIGPRPDGYLVRHMDDVKTNNHINNLTYGTRSDNAQDAIRNGRNSNLRKTHCPNNHAYEGDNLIIDGGYRRCRTCKNSKRRKK